MNFLNIPEEVVEGSLLPFLKWNDLLRFRRVCKATKQIAQDYLKVHPELAPEIEIGEVDTDRNFRAFYKMSIPTNRIFLNNISGEEFYDKDEKNVAKFLKKCGPLVKNLRVKIFSLYADGKEKDFMESLVNLQSFEAESFVVAGNAFTPEDDGPAGNEDIGGICRIAPNIFTRLKILRIGQQKGTDFEYISSCAGGFLGMGRCLEHVSLPFSYKFGTSSTVPIAPYHVIALAFRLIETAIKERAAKSLDKANLRTFDFRCYHDDKSVEAAQQQWASSREFLELLMNCVKYDIQLKNVGSVWFNDLVSGHEVNSPNLGKPILSLVNLHPCALSLNMPNLERIEIRATSMSSPGPGQTWIQQRKAWPALKCMDVSVDSRRMSCAHWVNGQREVLSQDGKIIFQFLFQDVRRINMTELRLHFNQKVKQLPIPKTEDIVASCPNLKKITLINWPGTNKALTKLWDGLPGLEEISLEYCKELGNVAFVGEDAKNPVFFKLKNLIKLSLKGLDRMPKITDTLFSIVLRNLNLTQLILTSDRPLKTITSAGIFCLLGGNFAGKIEKFPFQNWSLEQTSAQEFKKMAAKFRSYNML